MLVYYNPENFEIMGVSHFENPHQTYPFIVADGKVIEQIFLGHVSSLLYKVSLTSNSLVMKSLEPIVPRFGGDFSGKLTQDNKDGFLFLKLPHNSCTSRELTAVNNNIYQIPKDFISDPEFKIVQSYIKKTMQVSLKLSTYKWMVETTGFNGNFIFLTACLQNDPYMNVWTIAISLEELGRGVVEFNYVGLDNISLYTKRIFERCYHEQIT